MKYLLLVILPFVFIGCGKSTVDTLTEQFESDKPRHIDLGNDTHICFTCDQQVHPDRYTPNDWQVHVVMAIK